MKEFYLNQQCSLLMKSEYLVLNYPGQVPGQVFTKNRLKEVNYEKYKSISILYPIDYQ
jgi:hypothetical protein